MDETRVFKSYNGVLTSAERSVVFDYASAGYYEDTTSCGRRASRPAPQSARRVREWIRETPQERAAADELEARPISRKGQGISLATVAGFVLAALLLVTLLMSHVRMTALSDAAAASQTRLTELTEQQHKLRARYEEVFSLSEVERYATDKLGMQKPRAGQITYLDSLGSGDRAVVIVPEEENGLWSELLDSIRAYFG